MVPTIDGQLHHFTNAGLYDGLFTLYDADPSALQVLDDLHIDAVLWSRHKPLAALVTNSDQWRVTFSSRDWVLWERRI